MTNKKNGYETAPKPGKAYLVGIQEKHPTSLWLADDSITELSELAKTAGLEVVGFTIQKKDHPDPALYLGKGKWQDIQEKIEETKTEIIIADDELSPAQHRNLEKQLNLKILDRTSLVLDIFAQRAQTHEAQLQVELAQLKYLMPRLTRLWTHLSRLGGGIGTRGPGESQLEVDRRQIQTRIEFIKKGLLKVRKHRNTMRQKREVVPLLTATLVGYTNSGKSTLMNKATDSDVLAEDKLFATLDPTTRKIKLPNKEALLLTDTVGFIQKLPHHLVEAFMATLEEVASADILLHVVDASHPKCLDMIQTSESILKDIGASEKPQIIILNKEDKVKSKEVVDYIQKEYPNTLLFSARHTKSLQPLYEAIELLLEPYRKKMSFKVPYNKMPIVNLLHKKGQVLKEDYKDDCIEIELIINSIIGEKLMGQLYHH